MTEQKIQSFEAHAMLEALIDDGWLIGVEVFGTDVCCEHGEFSDCEATGFGLCDVFSRHSPGGSDCNRAERFLFRPHDALMTDTIAEKRTLEDQ